MASSFNSLHIGYTGLNAAQIAIDTTGHNISNAESEGYTRQRVVTEAATPISTLPGRVGNGAEVTDIQRVFDSFVFDRYTKLAGEKEYADFTQSTLEELSTYFPEIDNVGIKTDLQEYYNMWQTLADNPNNSSIKLSLAKQAQTLTSHIGYTQSQVVGLQQQLNEQLSTNITEVNSLAKQIADLNQSIDMAEAGKVYQANDLRDKRNVLEKNLAQLIGAEVKVDQVQSNSKVDTQVNTKTGSYTLTVNGFNIVDGSSYHPIKLSSENNPNAFYDLNYERQDGTLIPMAEKITGGKIGSILALRGAAIDNTSGMPTDGILQTVVSELDGFAKGLIESTNNLYAKSSSIDMTSNILDLNPTHSLVNSGLNINEGSFDVVVYDVDGNEVARRAINIDIATSMTGAAGTNSIQAQFGATKDDNNDGNATNDVNSFVNFYWLDNADGSSNVQLQMDSGKQTDGYTFSIEDGLKTSALNSGTNFAGSVGLNRFFDGDSASTIDLSFALKNGTNDINAGASPASGDNSIALDMVQHQYEDFSFHVGETTYNTTAYGMFDTIATEVGTETNIAMSRSDTVKARFNASELEYNSVSKVNIDEEMTNLIKYQTSYGAAAKVITTIDQMMQTLLGIKQ